MKEKNKTNKHTQQKNKKEAPQLVFKPSLFFFFSFALVPSFRQSNEFLLNSGLCQSLPGGALRL